MGGGEKEAAGVGWKLVWGARRRETGARGALEFQLV